jgi:hypothetical protein
MASTANSGSSASPRDLRPKGTRLDDHDADPLRLDLRRERLAGAFETEFRRAVRAEQGFAPLARHAGDLHDHAGGFAKQRQACAAERHRATRFTSSWSRNSCEVISSQGPNNP